MTIRKRLAISNILMIVVPIVITLLVGACCIGIIWFQIAHGTGLGFEDSESFYQACQGISEQVSEALDQSSKDDQTASLQELSTFLNGGGMSMTIKADGQVFYQYGTQQNCQLEAAAIALNQEGAISSGSDNLYVQPQTINNVHYQILIYGTQGNLSYNNLKNVIVIACIILFFTILLSIFLTDRFLTHFITRHIEDPLDLLADGVQQISEGNLGYRLTYTEKDEFLPVCQAFNEMAVRLQESVNDVQRQEESRKELMAGISHDLRTPLTSIQAYVEGMLDGVASTPDMQKRYLLTIKTKAEELERMVERILTYSRMELEEAPRDEKQIALDQYLKEEIDEISVDYSVRGLSISSQFEPYTIRADEAELRQILLNIADNSLKYKVKDQASLQITLRNEGKNAELIFQDDGPGVPQDSLIKIFDEFYRTDESRSNRSKGSGLGLAIVAKAAHRMGGSIRAENAENGGLKIILTLPGDKENE